MRKADIRTGVVYAYRQSRSYSPEPCVLLSTALHDGRRPRVTSGPWCTPSAAGSKAHYSRLYGATGYPALVRNYGYGRHGDGISDEDLMALMLTVGPAVLASGDVPEPLRLEIQTSLSRLYGPWEEVKAADDERRRREDAYRASQQEKARAMTARADAVKKVLSARGIFASWNSSLGTLAVSLDDAEKLAALLDEG